MARKPPEWAFHVIAHDGAATYGFPSKKAASEARKEILELGPIFVSTLIRMTPGDEHWVIHAQREDREVQSFGFNSQIEAQKFHNKVMEAGNIVSASFPVLAELE